MSFKSITLGFVNKCDGFINRKYQSVIFINKSDLQSYSINGNYIDFSLKSDIKGVRFELTENGNTINATFSKSDKNGMPRYSHIVNLSVFGNDSNIKDILSQFDNLSSYFAVLLNQNNIIEVFGFENGFKTESYEYDNSVTLNLTSAFEEYKIPFIYKNSLGNELEMYEKDFNESYFVSTWNATNSVITLPITTAQSSSLSIDWGDGTIDNKNTHTYTSTGLKSIKIKGEIKGFRFNNNTEAPKLINILNWGNFIIDSNSIFSGCTNLNLSDTKTTPKITTNNLDNLFLNCSSLTNINNLDQFDLSNVTSISGMFKNCTNFNQDINFKNTYNITNVTALLEGCINFNSNVNINTSNVSLFNRMLYGTTKFNKDISNLNVFNAIDLTDILKNNIVLSPENLSKIYSVWSLQNVNSGITLDLGALKYTQNGEAGKQRLISKGWTITDGGLI